MLAPHTWSRAEPARRQELLVRRRNLLQLNLPEEEIPEELSLPRIRCVLAVCWRFAVLFYAVVYIAAYKTTQQPPQRLPDS